MEDIGIQLLRQIQGGAINSAVEFSETNEVDSGVTESVVDELFDDGFLEYREQNGSSRPAKLGITKAGIAYLDAVNGNVDAII